MSLALVTALVLTAPVMETDGTLQEGPAIVQGARQAWADITKRLPTGVAAQDKAEHILLRRASLATLHSGASRPGQVLLRQGDAQGFDSALALALRHEIAHQVLLQACPAASDDRLFHEAFALAVSGELPSWTTGAYLSTPEAVKILTRAPSLDTPRARRALARLLEEQPGRKVLPEALERRLRLCGLDAYPRLPLAVAELLPTGDGGDAVVVLSRHSGEVLLAEGDVYRAMPFGSLLKPFIAAAHSATAPVLPIKAADPMWQCYARGTMTLADALVKSCNGYFMTWDPKVPWGSYTPALTRLGLGRAPNDMAEAIGLKMTLSLSPWSVAQAYRLLAATAPDVLRILRDTAQRGTLAGTAASAALPDWAIKSGTVRDAASRPLQGWLAAVSDDVVIVTTHRGGTPRPATAELVALARTWTSRRALVPADVDVFTRVAPKDVTLLCKTDGWLATSHTLRPVTGPIALARLRPGQTALCLGQPWQVASPRFAHRDERLYAGTFATDSTGAYHFRTTLGAYTAGVLRAEDASAQGPVARALARVIAHNAHHGRHAGDHPCDTTHCQVFFGTDSLTPDGVTALAHAPLPSDAWLHFSRGGSEPWRARRDRKSVEQVLQTPVEFLTFHKNIVSITAPAQDGVAVYDDVRTRPCEFLRNPLHLPSCPTRAVVTTEWVEFAGLGEGHGIGLDVEWAKESGLGEEALLRQAYFNPQ